jgi:translocator protein
MYKLIVFVVSILGSFSAGAIGSLAAIPNIPTWYATLNKPPLNPPNWVFGPVWSVLYVLIGAALALVILAVTERPKKRSYFWFSLQFTLNAAWSLVFFGLHLPWLGVAVIITLIISIVMTMREFYRINRLAVWLFAPYLAWVCFASYLTVGIALLNS